MKLNSFLSYFARIQHVAPDKTTIMFCVGEDEFLAVRSVEFSLETNAWVVQLAKSLKKES